MSPLFSTSDGIGKTRQDEHTVSKRRPVRWARNDVGVGIRRDQSRLPVLPTGSLRSAAQWTRCRFRLRLRIYCHRPTSAMRVEEWVVTVTSGVLIVGASPGLLFLGQQTTTSGVAVVIIGTVPVLTTGFARLIPPQEHLNRRKLVGLVTGLVGIVLVVRPSLAQFGGEIGTGKLLIFLGAACFAFGSVATQRVTVSLPVETYQAWALGFDALFIHSVSLLLGESVTTIQWTSEGVWALLYLIVIRAGSDFFFISSYLINSTLPRRTWL